jgi:hypothetical protein
LNSRRNISVTYPANKAVHIRVSVLTEHIFRGVYIMHGFIRKPPQNFSLIFQHANLMDGGVKKTEINRQLYGIRKAWKGPK